MRKITVLAIAAAAAVVSGLIGICVRMGQQHAPHSVTAEPEVVTGAIVPRPTLTQPTPLDPDVTVASPRPELSSKPTRGDSAANSKPTCRNPTALGTSRVVEIDTTGGPGFGFEHFKQHDF